MQTKTSKKANLTVNLFILSMCFLGLISIVLFSVNCNHILNWISISILISVTSFASGSLVGFIFGIPKINTNFNYDSTREFIANTTLEQIADWLTKIIIGVGLTQLMTIPKRLKNLGESIVLGVNSNIDPDIKYSTFVICIIIFYSILGFFFAYFYARIELKSKFIDTETFQNEINSETEKRNNLSSRLDEKIKNEKSLLEENKRFIKNILTNFQKELLSNIIKSSDKEYMVSSKVLPFDEYSQVNELIKLDIIEKSSERSLRFTELYKNLKLTDIM